jgi:hypothetical protein
MKKKLHLISFDVPYPPDYGGVIDVFYKIKSLAEADIDIILHCFRYGREKSAELENICYQVHYYERKKGVFYLFSNYPYIVVTRCSKKLFQNLQDEIAPVLFEGLHTCGYMDHPLMGAYNKIVRAHNIEHDYYHYLELEEQNSLRRWYYKQESVKLRWFEKKLKHASNILAISPGDTTYFKDKYQLGTYIPAFHPFDKVKAKRGMGDYILFHGNLSVNENLKGINYLLEHIFTEITLPFIIAGKNPPDWLIKKISSIPHVSLIANPDTEVMEHLIQNAQINLIPTFQPTGLKLKLLASLFLGRHCLTNSPMVDNTGLEGLCHVADKPSDMLKLIQQKFEEKITKEEIGHRKEILETQFSNKNNASKIYAII